MGVFLLSQETFHCSLHVARKERVWVCEYTANIQYVCVCLDGQNTNYITSGGESVGESEERVGRGARWCVELGESVHCSPLANILSTDGRNQPQPWPTTTRLSSADWLDLPLPSSSLHPSLTPTTYSPQTHPMLLPTTTIHSLL